MDACSIYLFLSVTIMLDKWSTPVRKVSRVPSEYRFCLKLGTIILRSHFLKTVVKKESQNHRITESQNGRGWKGPLWVV